MVTRMDPMCVVSGTGVLRPLWPKAAGRPRSLRIVQKCAPMSLKIVHEFRGWSTPSDSAEYLCVLIQTQRPPTQCLAATNDERVSRKRNHGGRAMAFGYQIYDGVAKSAVKAQISIAGQRRRLGDFEDLPAICHLAAKFIPDNGDQTALDQSGGQLGLVQEFQGVLPGPIAFLFQRPPEEPFTGIDPIQNGVTNRGPKCWTSVSDPFQ